MKIKTTIAIVGAMVAMSLAVNAVMAQQAGTVSLAEAMKPLLTAKP